MRQHLKPDGRIHGIITHGGDAPNIIPDYAAGLFYVRAASRSYRDELYERVKKCAEGAALATGTEVKLEIALPSIDPIRRNPALEGAVQKNMELLGLSIDPDDGRRGSSDIGNLSNFIGGPSVSWHRRFRYPGPFGGLLRDDHNASGSEGAGKCRENAGHDGP